MTYSLSVAGSSLEVCDSEGHTALHLAASNQHYHTIQQLLYLGAKPNPKTRYISSYNIVTL